jgi:hypothetical protein
MSIAQQVAEACKGKAAFTLYGGYASGYDGKITRFAQGHQEAERRNDKGRCTYARYHYADGSRLEYKYKGDGDYTLSTTPPKD